MPVKLLEALEAVVTDPPVPLTIDQFPVPDDGVLATSDVDVPQMF